MYDIAVCGIEEPESLEMAINGLYSAKLDSVILGWKMNEAAHAKDAAEQIRGEPKRLQQVRAKPAQYAVLAAENAIYRKVVIAADRGTVTVETRSATAIRKRAYGSAEALEEGFESTGMNEVLRANRRNPARIRERSAEALRTGERATIVEITPEQPPRRQEKLPPIPERHDGAAPARPHMAEPGQQRGKGPDARGRQHHRTRSMNRYSFTPTTELAAWDDWRREWWPRAAHR